MLPLYMDKKTGKEIDRLLSRFIWRGRKARLRFTVLQLSKNSGGLALPNILFYNWSNHVRIVAQWLPEYLEEIDSCDSWCCTPITLLSLLTNDTTKGPVAITQNPMISSTLRSWHDIMKYSGKNSKASVLTPIIGNAEFLPGIEGTMFHQWHIKGIQITNDLLQENSLMSFNQIQTKYGISSSYFFAFLQTRSFIITKFPDLSNIPSLYNMEKFLLMKRKSNRLLSECYKRLCSLATEPINKTKSAWERDLEIELS